ncbi:hypothetical protein NL676_035483 [Syzygium grande]|nr:hypothetical protein NL676_035483 [Syzygium grande]
MEASTLQIERQRLLHGHRGLMARPRSSGNGGPINLKAAMAVDAAAAAAMLMHNGGCDFYWFANVAANGVFFFPRK